MLPRERVFAALEHREPDRIPWGEHSIDYNVYEDILGRPTFVQAKMKETRALWEGRRDEVVESYKRDRLDLIRALDMDIVFVGRVPPKDYRPEPYTQMPDGTYRDAKGRIYHVSATTHDLMPVEMDRGLLPTATVESVQELIDQVDKEPLPGPQDSCWELVHHAVREMKATHFIMLLCGDLEWPRFGWTALCRVVTWVPARR